MLWVWITVIIIVIVVVIVALIFSSPNYSTSTSKDLADDPSSHTLTFVNNWNQNIWVAIQTNAKDNKGNPVPQPAIEDTGFLLVPGQSRDVSLPYQWAGRFWGRTGCDSTGSRCVTGDCPPGANICDNPTDPTTCPSLYCRGVGGLPPITAVEFNFDADGVDYYDLSMVDGYNLPINIYPGDLVTANPISGPNTQANGKFYNGTGIVETYQDVNLLCPASLQVKDSMGRVVGCRSTCACYYDDLGGCLPQPCCPGKDTNSDSPTYNCTGYDNGTGCLPGEWGPEYANGAYVFKTAAPYAYSYAYDDGSSLFTAYSSDGTTPTAYTIVFGLASGPVPANSPNPVDLWGPNPNLLTTSYLPCICQGCGPTKGVTSPKKLTRDQPKAYKRRSTKNRGLYTTKVRKNGKDVKITTRQPRK